MNKITWINTNNEVIEKGLETPDELGLRLAKELEKTQISSVMGQPTLPYLLLLPKGWCQTSLMVKLGSKRGKTRCVTIWPAWTWKGISQRIHQHFRKVPQMCMRLELWITRIKVTIVAKVRFWTAWSTICLAFRASTSTQKHCGWLWRTSTRLMSLGCRDSQLRSFWTSMWWTPNKLWNMWRLFNASVKRLSWKGCRSTMSSKRIAWSRSYHQVGQIQELP